MKNDLPDIELYHQELLRNVELRRMLKVDRQKRQVASLSDVDLIRDEDEDREFTKSYIRNCGLTPQR